MRRELINGEGTYCPACDGSGTYTYACGTGTAICANCDGGGIVCEECELYPPAVDGICEECCKDHQHMADAIDFTNPF